jgi:hypothetical protein
MGISNCRNPGFSGTFEAQAHEGGGEGAINARARSTRSTTPPSTETTGTSYDSSATELAFAIRSLA